MSSRGRVPAYALIIAVNGDNLRAPELDAAKLRNTLMSLGIPLVDMLTGRAATRQNIIQSLNNIADNPKIMQDAPIIIYYAGHAIQTTINIPGAGSRKVECIRPLDSFSPGRAMPIPDITISALLGRIARKSKYITLLFDCCHAASGARDDTTVDETSELTLEVDPDELAKLDGELWSEALNNTLPDQDDNSRTISAHPRSFRYSGAMSHVLIASCHETQKSQEYYLNGAASPQGLFTTALIEALDECKEDKVIWTVTPVALFKRIKEIMQDIQRGNPRALPYPQIPQCEGYNKDRPIFATPARPHGSHAIAPIVEYPDRKICVLPVGLLGVRPQTTFEIYDYPGGRLKLIGRYRVADSSDGRTVLGVGRELQLGPDAYAVMCTPPVALTVEMAGDFPALYSDRSFQTDLVGQLGSHEPLDRFIIPVRSGHAHKIRASYSRSQGSVELQNTYGGVLRICNARHAPDALVKAVMFYNHLDQPDMSSLHNPGMFDILIRELTPTTTVDWSAMDGNEVLVPRPDRAPIAMHPTNGCVVPGSDASFGLQIKNRGGYPFFVYVFYFDPNDYSISTIYLPPSPDMAPLPPRGELTVGPGQGFYQGVLLDHSIGHEFHSAGWVL
ncbi:hypothetical protein FRC08_002664 [Ceratobasidium sp. 394]|nr:hypothetical protein FRC08_002664 [Ceratobasidium sp. 394]KAG9078410.1 hypothetical protein FS749_009561 [Ceratobasidium sp. UAMH 11750]